MISYSPTTKKFYVELFNMNKGITQQDRDRMIFAENSARRDGYTIGADDGNGFMTWVSFDDENDALAFLLTYCWSVPCTT